ncbi:MAG TPA: sensor histidine kinase [Streptosporangiaceae bacterium]|nr:sensor histidine kinase [Streptosporangiaceae bacterium]
MITWLADPRRRDWLYASLLLLASVLQIAFADGAGPHPLIPALFASAVCVIVAVRRRYPGSVGMLAQALMATEFNIWHGLTAGGWTIAWFCALYGLAVWSAPVVFAVGAAFVGFTDMLPLPLPGRGPVFSWTAVPFAAGTVVVMLMIRRIVRYRDRRAELAERERDLAAREAVVAERARIARELHDAIAHNVSMMVVQAGAERKVIGKSPSGQQTTEVLKTIEQIGRGALTEMRRLVGMLRTDSGSADQLTPQPKLADLEKLAAQVREAGLGVELRIEGEQRELPIGIELSAYRIVQEALTNALKHAGAGAAIVRVSYRPNALEFEVSDDGGGAAADIPGGGHGLAGMRERVLLYGGEMDASARPGGGFAVRVRLPVT